ncbi:L-dopachrome tautomerase-related protein [uncultured Roseobacter sp.]|uniref:L-dopachrome tautomerase-related protein n=1 Tax=uncultured Roseobacter sp. TaxID=114847 RepID=UPI00263185B9|nr:L-dopachrome tautomerase-related protein [uncultured Roseobacter sp.]
MTAPSDWPIKAELFAELSGSVGNITFTPKSDVIFSYHPFFDPDTRVAKLNADRKSAIPFPNTDWNTPKEDTDQFLDSVLGLRCDGNGVVWMIDMGLRSDLTPKLVGWNTNTDSLERIYYVPTPAALPSSQHNDFTIDEKRRQIIIADEGVGRDGDGTDAALVVIDMKTGATRRLLQGHESCLPEKVSVVIDERELTVDGKTGKEPLRIGADGIVADLNFEWLYFGPLSGGWIYRIRLDDIADTSLSDAELGNRVEKYAEKPNNGGLGIDRDGNLYLTAVETNAVGIIPTETPTYAVYAAHNDIVWPDGVSYAPDGYMYVSAAQVSEAAIFNDGDARNHPPYRIFRFPPLAPSRLGY